MNIWQIDKWKKYYGEHPSPSGLRVRYEKNVDPEVKRSVQECVIWLRSKYFFPKRVYIYVKSDWRIMAKNGEMVCGTFFRPADRNKSPYIKVATGDYTDLLKRRGKDNALAAILYTLIHELTHYFQWINDLDLTLIGEERQATNYSKIIMIDYADTRDHP